MLRSIKKKLQRTPLKNSSYIIREIEGVTEDVLLSLITSPYLSEGVFSLETIANKEYTENLLVTPSFFRDDVGSEVYRDFSYLKNDIEGIHCYRVILSKPSFLPLYTDEPYSLFQNLTLLQSGDDEWFIQMLFTRRSDHWQDELINQYQSYLKGNDYPASSRLGRTLQHGILKAIDKINGIDPRREHIAEIEQKILDSGYRFEMRLVLYSKQTGTLEKEIRTILKEKDFFNELYLEKIKNKKEFLELFLERRYSEISKDQIISEGEFVSVTGGDVLQHKESPSIPEEKLPVVSRLSKLDLLPIGKKLEREVDIDIVNDIPVFLKKAKVIRDQEINIQDVELGATVQRVTFEIPKDILYSDIKKKLEDIQAVMGVELNIIQGNHPNTVTFLIPCKQREIIYLKELLENPEFLNFAEENPLPFVCGIDMFNDLVFKCLTKAPHLLVSGATNSGKSVFMNAMLITLLLFRTPQELRLILIDPKKVEFIQYNGFAHIDDIVIDMEEAVVTLDALVTEMEKRYEKFSSAGAKKIDSYNAKVRKKMPYIICAIDEYNDLKMQKPIVEEYIERLGQKARAAGIHLIIATQRPDNSVMSGVIKTNLPSRIAFKLDNNNEYRTVFGTGIPYKNLLGFGDGVVKYVGQTEEFIRFQAPVISLDEKEEERAYNDIMALYESDVVDPLLQLNAEAIEPPIEKLRRIIEETGETRVKELQKEMGIRINDVSDMLKQLADEGFLVKENRSYVLTSNIEENK